jgi:hypothetical protein
VELRQLVLQGREALHLQQEQLQALQEETRIMDSPSLAGFYRSTQTHMLRYLLSVRLGIGSGGAGGGGGGGEGALSLLGALVPMPGAGIASALLSAVTQYMTRRRSRRAQNAMEAVEAPSTLSGVDITAQAVALLITQRFEQQIILVSATSNRGVALLGKAAVRRVAVGVSTIRNDDSGSTCSASRMFDDVVGLCASSVTAGLGRFQRVSLDTVDPSKDESWNDEGLFRRPTIVVRQSRQEGDDCGAAAVAEDAGDVLWGFMNDKKRCRPDKYGSRLGTAQEAEALGFHVLSAAERGELMQRVSVAHAAAPITSVASTREVLLLGERMEAMQAQMNLDVVTRRVSSGAGLAAGKGSETADNGTTGAHHRQVSGRSSSSASSVVDGRTVVAEWDHIEVMDWLNRKASGEAYEQLRTNVARASLDGEDVVHGHLAQAIEADVADVYARTSLLRRLGRLLPQ